MELVKKFESLIYYTLNTEDRTEVKSLLDEFAKTYLPKLKYSRDLLNKNSYRIAFVGLTNVGKSTLIEALFKTKLTPRRNGPATAVATEFKYAHEWEIILHKGDNQIERLKDFSDQSQVIKVLEKYVLQNDNVKTDVSLVVVQGRIDLLKDSKLIIVDTPGFGSAQACPDISHVHNTNLNKTLCKVDEFYFCVSGRDGLILQIETSFFDKYVKEKCGTVIVNKWEEEDEKSREHWKNLYAPCFPGCKFHFVEAKQAIKDGGGHGLDELKKIILANSSTKNMEEKITRELLSYLDELFHIIDHNYNGTAIKWSYPEMMDFYNVLRLSHPSYQYLSRFNKNR